MITALLLAWLVLPIPLAILVGRIIKFGAP